jgi:hypothetical protein
VVLTEVSRWIDLTAKAELRRWERVVKARKVLEGASFSPETLKVVGEAFDDAWASIAHLYGSELEIERARLRLANSILAVAALHEHNVEALKKAALAHMAINYRDRSEPGAPKA